MNGKRLLPSLLSILALFTALITAPVAAESPSTPPTEVVMPAGGAGPRCSRDIYQGADNGTTSVPRWVPNKDRRPIVYVHGWNSSEKTWTGDTGFAEKLKQQLGNKVDNFVFDYSDDSIRWANNDKIAACLGEYITSIGSRWKETTGADGKVIVIGHSMGGLAILYSSSAEFAQYPSGPYLGGVVTLDTPYLGSVWGNFLYSGPASALETVRAAWSLQLLPSISSDAASCLGVHRNGGALPSPCSQPIAPPLPDDVPLTTLQSNIIVDRKLFGRTMYSVDLQSDGIVGVGSQKGYAAAYSTPPKNKVDTSKVVNCHISTDALSAAGMFSGVGLLQTAAVTVGTIATDAPSLLGDAVYDNNRDKSGDLNLIATLGLANMKANCSHTHTYHFQSTVNQTTDAVKSYLAALKSGTGSSTPTGGAEAGSTEGLTILSSSKDVYCDIKGADTLKYAANYSVMCRSLNPVWRGGAQWASDPRPDDSICSHVYTWDEDSVGLMREGVSAGTCAFGDTPQHPNATVLPEGESAQLGSVTCTSQKEGISCDDSVLGTGFTVSTAALTRRGPVPDWPNGFIQLSRNTSLKCDGGYHFTLIARSKHGEGAVCTSDDGTQSYLMMYSSEYRNGEVQTARQDNLTYGLVYMDGYVYFIGATSMTYQPVNLASDRTEKEQRLIDDLVLQFSLEEGLGG